MRTKACNSLGLSLKRCKIGPRSGASIPIYRWRQCAMGNFGGEFIFTKGFAKL